MKKVFPVIWFAAMAVAVVGLTSDPDVSFDPLLLLVFLPAVLVGAWFYYKLIWTLADRVEDGGDCLLVRRGSTELRISFADVMNVGFAPGTQPQRLSLRLRKVGAMGDEILFIPVQRWRWDPTARNPLVEELIQKIDSARRAAP